LTPSSAQDHIWFSHASLISSRNFWYFWLTIQNTATSQVRNLFSVVAVFISFPLARAESVIPGRKAGKKKRKKEEEEEEKKKNKKASSKYMNSVAQSWY
jgi:hypothetical protein